MNRHPVLEAAVKFRRGSFMLDARFALTSRWTVLFGASGAGKTTLLRILAGLTQPVSGSIRLGETQLLDASRGISLLPGNRGIGFVLQQAALFPHLTARDNISFGLHGWTRVAREARVDELVRMFEMEALGSRKPRELSGGERQRIALAQALARRPQLLLLDEPFNALDASTRAFVIEKLRTMDVPVLYVSHTVADAWEINANALLLEAGRITAHGPTRTVLASQRERLLAQLEA